MYQLRTPKTKFSAQRKFICPGETEGRGKGQRQEIEEEGRVREQGKGHRVICPGGTKDCI